MWFNYRLLSANEIIWAKSVFDTSLPYGNIYLADGYLPANHDVAVTVMSYSGGGNSIEPALETPRVQNFSIYWGPDIYKRGADVVPNSLDTFIHELTHVWQGYNEKAIFNYMIRSMTSQGWAIARHLDRNQAYEYDANNYLKWSDYNVEQQGNIVRDWFSGWNLRPNRGNRSTSDPRFVYIDKVIRAGNPNAPDTPGANSPQGAQQTPTGFSAAIQAYQRLLIRKGYPIKDDGFNGARTDKVVRDFQRRHGLKADGFVGPKTLALLNRP